MVTGFFPICSSRWGQYPWGVILRAPLLLLLLPSCAAPAPSDPAAAYSQLQQRYARAHALELTGTLESSGRRSHITFRAALPAAGSLEITTTEDFFGEMQTETQRWVGDGSAIYLLNGDRRECVLTAASWRQLELLSQLDFLAPAWTAGQPPAPAALEWAAPVQAGRRSLRLLGPDGERLREYEIRNGQITGARGWTADGAWVFTAEHSVARPAAAAASYAVRLPADYAILGTPESEFNHLRGLLNPGEYAPEITLIGLDGAEHTLSEFRGRRMLIAFWFYH